MTTLIAPFLGALFRRRAKSGKEDLTRIPERFAKALSARPEGALVWLHAASVGESQVQLELARRLISETGVQATFLFTCQTQTAARLILDAIAAGGPFETQPCLQQMAP
ncbi:MAG: glycosyltransferase N-terminal domain-containing protein, partial [Pseudomonadota bacterium]